MERHEQLGRLRTVRTVTGLAVTSLVRGSAPEVRAARAQRALLRTVAEWPHGSGLEVRGWSSRTGRVSVELIGLGTLAADWHQDVTAALRPVLSTARRYGAAQAGPVGALAELVRDPARSVLRSAGADAEGWRSVRTAGEAVAGPAAVAWPMPLHEVDGDLRSILHDVPGAVVRTVLAAPSGVERAMLLDELEGSWDRHGRPDFDLYLGAPVLARTFVGTAGGRAGAARARAAVRGWGTGLVLTALDEAEIARVEASGLLAVAGHVRPEGWALALLRVPVAGEQPVPGFPSHHPAVTERPLVGAQRAAGGVPVGTATGPDGRRTSVVVQPADLLRHLAIEGATGSGKTSLVATLVAGLSARGVGCTLLEHHGSGVDLALRALPAAAAERAVVVRHGDLAAPAALNLFDEADATVLEQVVSEFADLVQAIFDPRGEGIVGPRWRRWFTLLCDGVSAAFGTDATLLHLLAVASDPARARRLATAVAPTHPDLAQRIDHEVGSLRGEEAANLPAWAISKFQPLVGQRAMRAVVGRPRDAVDVLAVLDEGRPLLVDLGGPVLGAGSARMLAAIWLLKHWVAMGRRADRRRPHVVVVDEAHLMTFGALPAMLAEARKFGIGVVVAGQSIDAYAPALQSAVEANVGSYVTFRLGLQTAGRASSRLDGWPAAELLRLPDFRAATVLSRSGAASEPFLLRTTRPDADTPAAAARALAADERNARRWRAAVDRSVDVTDLAVDRWLDALVETGRRQAVPDQGGVRKERDRSEAAFAAWMAARGRKSDG